MDRNTVIGLVIIGLILSVFAIFNKPTEEELKNDRNKTEQVDENSEDKEDDKKIDKSDKPEKNVPASALIPKLDDAGKQVTSGDSMLVFIDTITGRDTTIAKVPEAPVKVEKVEVVGEIIRLENEKLIVDFTTKGGQISAVYLKEFETYKEFAKNDKKLVPLPFFKEGDAINSVSFPVGDRTVRTEKQLFKVKKQTASSIVFEWIEEDGKSIEFKYDLNKNAYDLDYTIHMKGYGDVTAKNIQFNWKASLPRTERLFSEQRRVSTVCFNYKDEGFSWLSEIGDDEIDAEDAIEWVSFKQSYFSSILRPTKAFGKNGSEFRVDSYEDNDSLDWSHLKGFGATMNLNLDDASDATVQMNWYFGPNDYETLRSYGEGYDDVLNYGWGLFRWINLYAVQPVFNVLLNWGIGAGIAILILTLILKFILMPIQWKMYVSSAKMRILRPEIDEINKKYPEKEDAMKKQMETMAMYRESGASPLAGCVPMLIQMPILLAVFRFFPSTFELRQKSFLWAEDLSSYDSIWDFGINIWFYGDHVSLFTLLMAATTLVYTYVNSGNMQTPQQPGMPNMKVIMYIFPFLMIFFFNNYSSGLSYYYFISTLVSILIMVMIKQFFVDEDKLKEKMALRKANATAGGTTKTKSKFQERLEQMQKKQQEQLKNRQKK